MDGHRGEWTARDGRHRAPHEHSGRPSWECRTTTQDEHLQKFHNEIGFIPDMLPRKMDGHLFQDGLRGS